MKLRLFFRGFCAILALALFFLALYLVHERSSCAIPRMAGQTFFEIAPDHVIVWGREWSF